MDNNPNQIIYTNLATRIRDNHLLLSVSKEIKSKYNVDCIKFELPPAVQSIIDLDKLQQVRIKQDRLSKEWHLLIIYKVEPKDKPQDNNIMSIDLGLDNLATLTFKDSPKSYIINGKTIKSKNSYFNKKIANLQRIRMKQLSTIIIGNIKNIKQNNTLKSFVQIPIQRLVELIEYKAKLAGIKLIKVNETYTSGCSAIDLESLNKTNYDKSRRTTRGLFKTKNKILNADVNGSLNIMRKYLKDKCIPEMIRQIRDNGVVDTPKRIRVAC